MLTLSENLVFKDGTALKECYFGDYRFSEDLDFIEQSDPGSGLDMERHTAQVCEVATRFVEEYANLEINCERYTEREPHSGGQEAFDIYATYPWQG